MGILLIYLDVQAADRKIIFHLPELSPLLTPNQCKCNAIASAGLYAYTKNNNHISADVQKGTDNISIQIEGETLYFLSGASFKLGEAKPAEFQIIKNTNTQVFAIFIEETKVGGITVDSFTLQKNTGLAVWTKTRSYDLFSGRTPSTQSLYLICK